MVKKPNNKEFKGEMQRLQFEIGQHLLNNRTRPNISFKITISKSTMIYLKDKYKLNFSRFKESNSIFNDLNIIKENVYNRQDYNTIEEFKLKFIKEKEKVLNLRNGGTQIIKSENYLTIKFRRVNQIILDENDLNFLVNFVNN